MRNRVNRMSSATGLVMILMITSTVIMVSPTAMALTITTTATADTGSNPVSVGNQVQLMMNIDPDPPSGYYYQNILINVTRPDETVSVLGPYSTDAFGQVSIFFTPTLVGTYSLNFSYSGETLNGNTYTPCEVAPVVFDSVPDMSRVHNLDTGLGYNSIQHAINAPETLNGHTIFVDSGTYRESVEITKSITLTGEDSTNTIIDGGGSPSSVVYVEDVDGVTISGLTIQNGEDVIHLRRTHNCIVYGNNIKTSADDGIELNDSYNATVSENTITNSTEHGIHLVISDNCTVSENTINSALDGIYLDGSDDILVSENNVTNSTANGIYLLLSDNNIISRNSVTNNSFGISISNSSGDIIYHNNFIDNTVQTSVTSSNCTWDEGYPSGGNYWSDYNGTDADGDGIGDTAYVINEENQDNYPLLTPLGTIQRVFNVTAGSATFYVRISSNSSISEFEFSEPSLQVSFNVTGLNGTTGFCNITIPEGLLWGDFLVYLNGEPLVEGTDYTRTYNGIHNSFYITYSYSSHMIEITGTHVIPEYYSLTVLSFLLTTISLIVTKRKWLFHQEPERM
jgi:parallel beta-helix repeat protein